MPKRTMCLTLLVSALALPVVAEEKPTLQAYSVSVRKLLSRDDAKIYFEETSGVRIQAVLALPGKAMLAVDEKASKLESFKDDVGTDLTKAQQDLPGTRSWIESFAFKASEKGDRALVTFNAGGLPAASAKKIVVRGTMALLCGSGAKTVEAKDVELKPDPKAKTKLGDVTYTIEKSFGNDLQVRFESTSPNVRSVAFTTAAGQAIKLEKPSTSRFGFNNKYSYNTSYYLQTKEAKINIALTYFEKTEVVDFPVALTVGIGLE